MANLRRRDDNAGVAASNRRVAKLLKRDIRAAAREGDKDEVSALKQKRRKLIASIKDEWGHYL